MNDWTPNTVDIDLSFLLAGNFTMDVMRTGVNADRNASDYRKIIASGSGNKAEAAIRERQRLAARIHQWPGLHLI